MHCGQAGCGVTPCPFTIFTFGLFLLATEPTPGAYSRHNAYVDSGAPVTVLDGTAFGVADAVFIKR